jgi:hypothetical protein
MKTHTLKNKKAERNVWKNQPVSFKFQERRKGWFFY